MARRRRHSKNIEANFFGPAMYASNGGHISIMGSTTDIETIKGIISGKARGLSPQFRIKWFECSICHKNQEDCIHEQGVEYGGVKCESIARDLEFIETSIVPIPADSRTYITDLLVISEDRKTYDWYGFCPTLGSTRFKNIQMAFDKGKISFNVATKFSQFFALNDIGLVSSR